MVRGIKMLLRSLSLIEGRVSTLSTRLYFRLIGVAGARNLDCRGMPIVRRYKNAEIIIGTQVSFYNHSRANLIGINSPCILVAAENARIEIGDYTGLSGTVIHSRKRISLGRHVKVGANCKIVDHDFHPLDYQKRRDNSAGPEIALEVEIGDDVFIGTNALILKGVKIGNGAIIGAGAVVTKSVPAFTVWAGNPARQIGELKGNV
jgi:acetyltransferase-like isoleucine patch superfamily enzyme